MSSVRLSISPAERLAVTLRFLATVSLQVNSSHYKLSYFFLYCFSVDDAFIQFRIECSTMGVILRETCKAI